MRRWGGNTKECHTHICFLAHWRSSCISHLIPQREKDTLKKYAMRNVVLFALIIISLRTEKWEDLCRCHGECLLCHGHSFGHVAVFRIYFYFFYRMETVHLANANAGTRTHCPGFLLSRALSFVKAELCNMHPTLTYPQYRHEVWDAWDRIALTSLRSSVLKHFFSQKSKRFPLTLFPFLDVQRPWGHALLRS